MSKNINILLNKIESLSGEIRIIPFKPVNIVSKESKRLADELFKLYQDLYIEISKAING